LTLSALSALSKVPKVLKVDPAENLMQGSFQDFDFSKYPAGPVSE